MFNYSFFFLFFGPADFYLQILSSFNCIIYIQLCFFKKIRGRNFFSSESFFQTKKPPETGGARTFLRCEMLDGLHDKIGNPGTDQRADGNAFEESDR